MTHLLDGCWAKIDRAEEHLASLKTNIDAFLESKPYRIDIEPDDEPGSYRFVARDVAAAPLRWGILVGDIVHNLRSALDHLVCVLVRLDAPTDDCTRTQFPICDTETGRAGWQGKRDAQLAGVRPGHIAAIQGLQPYHRGDSARFHPLAVLRWLSNVDKHRVVHLTMTLLADERPELDVAVQQMAPPVIVDIRYRPGPLVEGAVLLYARLFPTDPEPDVGVKGQLPIHVTLRDRNIGLADLERIKDAIRAVINRFVDDCH